MPVQASHLDRSITALLVDRDAGCRDVYGRFLKEYGCDVDEAPDGREALAKAFSRRPDVIITSISLPGMSGFDLCQVIRTDNFTSSIPIVVLTDDTPGEGDRALSVGADSVLPKACLPGNLFAEIKALLLKSDRPRAASKAFRSESGSGQAADESLDRVDQKRVMLSHAFGRHMTTMPSIQPRDLLCPHCSRPLTYTKSYIGGVSARHPEQWDYFECQTGCGSFQYRHRTRKLRRTP